MSERRSVLIITSEFPPNVGGIGNHAYNLALALSNAGHRVVVLADFLGIDKTAIQTFAANLPFTIVPVIRRKLVVGTYLSRIRKAISCSGKCDQVICSGKFSLWMAHIIRLFRSRLPLTAIVHGSELDLKASWAHKLTTSSLCRFNTIISVSSYTQRFLPASLPAHISRFVIGNGINGSEFEGVADHTLKGHPAFITIGSVTERKGQENVINALPLLKAQYPECFYHVVGKPYIQQQLQRRIDELHLSDTVAFHGAVERNELLQKLKSATIKFMLSNHTASGDFEGFGIAVLEANAFGVPVIGSANSGIADAIDHGRTGLLVDNKDVTAIADAVKTILADYAFFSANARKWAAQHDWKIIVQQYEQAIFFAGAAKQQHRPVAANP